MVGAYLRDLGLLDHFELVRLLVLVEGLRRHSNVEFRHIHLEDVLDVVAMFDSKAATWIGPRSFQHRFPQPPRKHRWYTRFDCR